MSTLPSARPEDLPLPEWFDPRAVMLAAVGGKSLEEIAKGYGVTRYVLNYYLLSRAPDDWKEAQVMRAIQRKETAEEEMDAAGDMLAFQKAQAKLKGAQWDLERVCRRIYGEAERAASGATVIFQIANLRGPAEVVEIDGTGTGEE